MLIQNTNNLKHDIFVRKARVLIKDKDNKIVLISIADSYVLPGGTVEDGEETKITALRELEEEVGLYINDCEYLTTITHYHENFPNLKENFVGKRVNKIDYYYADLDELNLKESHPTEFETTNNMKVIRVTLEELNELFGAERGSFKFFMDEELSTIISYAKAKGII